jgi:hypothetical protein
MIHVKRGRLPAGARAVALREDGRIVVYVSEELSARQRLAAIREALRAAPAAGWRPEHSPVLLPALALCAGLRQAPEGRWSYRMMVAALAGAALLITATTLTTISVQHGGVYQPAAAGPGRPPLTGAGPATSQSATGRGTSAGRQPGNGSSPAQPGTAPKPGKTTTTSAGGPAPQASGTPAPVPTSVSTSSPSPQPSQAAAPSPSPSPAHQSGGSGSCVDVLGITLCL